MGTRAKKRPRRLARELVETAARIHEIGLMDRATYDKITIRHLPADTMPKVTPVTPAQVRAMRARAKMSQAVFVRHLNMTVGYVSQLERGMKQPTGAALALLSVIRCKGIEAIL